MGKFTRIVDGKLVSAEEDTGSGGGPSFSASLNLMLLNTAANNWAADKTDNFNAEVTVGDWAAYADAAGAAPVDMTGGTPNTTIARTTTNEINGVASFEIAVSSGATRQGEGISCLVNIPTAYRGRSLTFKAPFTLTGTLTEDDFRIFAYDVTNSVVITPFTSGKILGSAGMMQCTFPVSTNTAQIRVGIHVARAVNTGAVTIQFDDVILSPDSTPVGLAGTDSIDVSDKISFDNWGTVTNVKVYEQRVGDKARYYGTLTLGTLAGGTAAINLPAGRTINYSKISTASVGSKVGEIAQQAFSGTNTLYSGNWAAFLFVDGSTNNKIFHAYQMNSSGFIKLNGSGLYVSNQPITFDFEVPIAEWSSNISVAESSTVLISSFLANGTRVTGTAPTRLGEYRSYLRNGGARTFTETNGAPAVAPTVANGVTLYGGNAWSTADTNNEPTKYEIFVGKNKNIEYVEYLSAGKTGFIDSDMFPFSTYDVGFAKNYDPVTGIFTIVRPTPLGGGASSGHLVGVVSNGDISGDDRIYFDIRISENALAVSTQQPRSSISLGTPSNFGSTNTKIVRWTVVIESIGSAITYADSSTLGTSLTINEDGIYSIHFSLPYSSTGRIGISKNSTQLTTDIQSITAANALIQTDAGSAGESITTSWTGFLRAGDVIRNHAQGGTLVNESFNRFVITKVSN